MITRGHFIGQIIDELSAISALVEVRSKLGLYDLHKYCEDFFKEILNIVLDYNLKNLNAERQNNPGIDLGDENKKIAFQITSTKTIKKINETLEKAESKKDKYETIYILIIGKKQGSYTLDQNICDPFNFKEENILDISDVLRKCLYLEIDKLKELYGIIKNNVHRVNIELEIPDEKGQYPTNINDYIEKLPKPNFKGVSEYYIWLKNQDGYDGKITEEITKKDFELFIAELKKLPRITRDFYAVILERAEWESGYAYYINYDYLFRISNLNDMQGELRLLKELCYFEESDDSKESHKYWMTTPRDVKDNFLLYNFMEYVKEKNLSLNKIIVGLDFSGF
jgi:hypothetical protein